MTPAISIIIPMYNMEKYVGECLESILAQTFQDFEVIVVDDCSTDESCAVVKKYLPSFNNNDDKLRLIESKKNSGLPGIPRNKGIELARGKYLCFVDSDDAITNTALEELFNVAEEFQADVVHCERYFLIDDADFTTDKNLLKEPRAAFNTGFVTEPTFMSEDIEERLDIFAAGKFDWSTCNNFIRRDFIKKNNLKIPSIKICEDGIFSIYLLSLAEKILRVPNVFYIYRKRHGSLSRINAPSIESEIVRWGSLFFQGFTILEKFFSGRKICENQISKKFSIFNFFMKWRLQLISDIYSKAPFFIMDKLVRQELEKVDDQLPLAAYFFDYANLLKLDFIKQYSIKMALMDVLKQVKEDSKRIANEYYKMKDVNQALKDILYKVKIDTEKMSDDLSQIQEKNDELIKMVKKQRAFMNYQRVQVQNLKSVLELESNLQDNQINGGE